MTTELERIVEARESLLRLLTEEQIRTLPGSSTERIAVDNKGGVLTVYHHLIAGRHCVVVQGVLERWGGITAKVVARGFEAGGTYRALTEEELYDYT
jgi:hypothetical protein